MFQIKIFVHMFCMCVAWRRYIIYIYMYISLYSPVLLLGKMKKRRHRPSISQCLYCKACDAAEDEDEEEDTAKNIHLNKSISWIFYVLSQFSCWGRR